MLIMYAQTLKSCISPDSQKGIDNSLHLDVLWLFCFLNTNAHIVQYDITLSSDEFSQRIIQEFCSIGTSDILSQDTAERKRIIFNVIVYIFYVEVVWSLYWGKYLLNYFSFEKSRNWRVVECTNKLLYVLTADVSQSLTIGNDSDVVKSVSL